MKELIQIHKTHLKIFDTNKASIINEVIKDSRFDINEKINHNLVSKIIGDKSKQNLNTSVLPRFPVRKKNKLGFKSVLLDLYQTMDKYQLKISIPLIIPK